MDPQDIISSGVLELYAAGLASPQEREQVALWVKEYPEVAAELDAIQSTLEQYAQANAVEPAAGVKDKVFASINTATSSGSGIAPTPAKVVAVAGYWKWVAAASIVLLVGSAAMNMLYYNKYNTASDQLKTTQEQLASVQEKNNDAESIVKILRDTNSMPVSLKQTGSAPGTNAKIFWMQDSKEVWVDASNLPDVPSDKQYQFWAIVNGVPVDGGLIITDDKGKKFRMQKMKSFGKADAFAISLEKKGGNATPTEVVSVGKVI
ncbi:anti-sigma factor [Ferruginibacter sp.]